MLADGNDRHARHAALGADVLGEHTVYAAGGGEFGEQAARNAELVHDLEAPVLCFDVHKLRRRCDGILRALAACEHIRKQIRREQQAVCALQNMRTVFAQAQKLEHRVQLHELDARFLIKLLARDDFERFIDHALCAKIAVVNGIFHEAPELVQQAEVDAPGVDADAVEAAFQFCLDDTLLDLIKQPQRIPVCCAAHVDGIVGKPMDFFQRDFAVGKRAENSASA